MPNRLTYLLLSPTFGMHQYTADLANRAVNGDLVDGRPDVTLVTTTTWVANRYDPQIRVHTPVTAHGTGFAMEGVQFGGMLRALSAIEATGSPLVHITGVHAWNVLLTRSLRRRGIRVVHTLHDLDPHHGVRFGAFIRLWNKLIIASVDHVLVHGRCYEERLLRSGLSPNRVTYTPLLHLFLSHERSVLLKASGAEKRDSARVQEPLVLFFGRAEPYKGIDILLAAWRQVHARVARARLIIAGPVSPDVPISTLPPNVQIRDRLIGDDEALWLFQTGDLLVLPYLDATQSALIAAGCFFGLPVIATATGALPEYVEQGRTGWIVPPGDADALAAALVGALANRSRLAEIARLGKLWYYEQRSLESDTLRRMYTSLGLS